MSDKIPVTVLTGFLGSGKTTLLNRILSEQHGLRIAVIENEFGAIGIDQDLVINADEEVFEMNNGCICCTVRGDLIRILGNLVERKDKFDRVILETTGLADPGPVAQTFFVDEAVREHYELDGIITLVDAMHVGLHLESSDEVVAQIAFADRIVLNKLDLISTAEQRQLTIKLQSMNKMATIYPATMAEVAIDELLDIGGFDLARVLEEKPEFLEPEYPFEWGGIWSLKEGIYHLLLEQGPDPEISVLLSEALAADESHIQQLAEQVFTSFSTEAVVLESGDLLRDWNCHYLLNLQDRPLHAFEIRVTKEGNLALFTQHTPDEFGMKLVRADGAEMTPHSEHSFNAGHEHDNSVSSVAVELPGLFDMNKINAWLDMFLKVKGQDIFRMKGIVGVRGESSRFVFQGVHMIFGGQPGKPWGNEKPVNRMIFIGRDLNEDYINRSLRACLM
jgi:G3E family GTPase